MKIVRVNSQEFVRALRAHKDMIREDPGLVIMVRKYRRDDDAVAFTRLAYVYSLLGRDRVEDRISTRDLDQSLSKYINRAAVEDDLIVIEDRTRKNEPFVLVRFELLAEAERLAQ